MRKLYTFPDSTIDRQFKEVVDSANNLHFGKLPAPPDAENEYVLATKNGAFYWVPSVAPAPAPEVTFG